MALPKQVRQQIADAQRIEGEIKAAAIPPADQTPSPAPAEPVVAPVVAAPAPVAAQPQPDAQFAELLQQYRSLQGIHRALVRSNGELQSKAQGLQEQMNTLTTEVAQLRQKPSVSPSIIAPITDDEIKEFGPDLISVIERKAQQVAAPLNEELVKVRAEAEALKRHNAELEQSLNGISRNQAEDAQARFQTDLVRLVPNFNALNFDNNFLSWLSQTDPLDVRRRTLQERLNEAVELGDAEATASFFNTFKTLVAAQPTSSKPNLAAQAQPASRAAPDNAPVRPGRQWSQADIGVFYADVSRGKYSPQEKVRIEKEIFSAQKDNRIAA